MRPQHAIHSSRVAATDPAMLLVYVATAAVMPALLLVGISPFAGAGATCWHTEHFCLSPAVVTRFLRSAFAAFVFAGIVRSAWRRFVGLWRSKRRIRRILRRELRHEDVLCDLAVRFGVMHRLRVMCGLQVNPAFTAGLLRPRIYISEHLQYSLSADELAAVLLHEKHHCERRDPLRAVTLAFLADAFFWLPLVRNVTSAFVSRLEFAADDAARHAGDGVVAAAIRKFGPRRVHHNPQRVSSFAKVSLAERRIARLSGAIDGVAEPMPTARAVMLSAVALSWLWILVSSMTVGVGPVVGTAVIAVIVVFVESSKRAPLAHSP